MFAHGAIIILIDGEFRRKNLKKTLACILKQLGQTNASTLET